MSSRCSDRSTSSRPNSIDKFQPWCVAQGSGGAIGLARSGWCGSAVTLRPDQVGLNPSAPGGSGADSMVMALPPGPSGSVEPLTAPCGPDPVDQTWSRQISSILFIARGREPVGMATRTTRMLTWALWGCCVREACARRRLPLDSVGGSIGGGRGSKVDPSCGLGRCSGTAGVLRRDEPRVPDSGS